MLLRPHRSAGFCCLVLVGVAMPAHASAADVLWLGDASPIRAALGFELAPRGLSIETDLPPSGEDLAERAARSRIACEARGARVAVWIEASPPAVHTVRIEDATVREAPLPASLEPARLVAMVAASLIDETLSDDAAIVEPARAEEPGAAITLDSPTASTEASIEASPADEPTHEPEAGDGPPPVVAPYVAMTVYAIGTRFDGVPIGGQHSLEVGLAIERTFRIAAHVIGTLVLARPVTGSGGGGSTAGGAGGLTVSARGTVGDVEMRGGLGLSMIMRGVYYSAAREYPLRQPGTQLQLGGLLEVHGRIGGRVSPTCALLGGVGLHGALLEDGAPHGMVSASLTMEWF